jgi:RNA 2',3'-cyclic 3'-phosphodiesterase
MKHRIFIAVNLPEKIKKDLSLYSRKLPELPVRWTKPDNLHITLEFLGYVSPDEIREITKIVGETAARHSSFTIKLNKICYGPPDKMPPRMIWAEGEKSGELGALKEDLQQSLSSARSGGESGERAFKPHITLGRIRAWDFRKIEPEERPEVDEEINLNFNVESVEIMESQLKRGGPEYFALESCRFQN